MGTQSHVFENQTSNIVEVYVEMYPDRYRLRPGDIMQITCEGEVEGLHTILHADGSLQIYPPSETGRAIVAINGKPAKPWED